MNLEQQNHGYYASSDSSNLTNLPNQPSKLSNFFDQVHSISTLHVISAILQVGFSAGIIFISVLGLIRPLWISTLMSMFASVTCMVGFYLLYNIVFSGQSKEQLIRDAMRRIMNAQN